jgi:hypothetical protein
MADAGAAYDAVVVLTPTPGCEDDNCPVELLADV